jgi:hypothetical protein
VTGLDASQALRHSKVRLTWDEDEPDRHTVTRRKLTSKEIEEADFGTYLASSSSESDVESTRSSRSRPKGLPRDQLRSLLLAATPELPEGWRDDTGNDVDMEVTFTPALSSNVRSGEEESTLDSYRRKMKERRQKRKEEVSQRTRSKTTISDEFFLSDNPPSQESTHITPQSTVSELALLIGNDHTNIKHFSMKAIVNAEDQRKHKKRRKRSKLDADDIQAEFSLDTSDARFDVIHRDPQFAIDPNDSQYVQPLFIYLVN